MKKIKTVSQKKKIGFLLLGVLLILLIAIILWRVFSFQGYRMIKIYEINGTAQLDRKDVNTMDAYENLVLQDKDQLAVATDSNVRLQMDADKYALIEENSKVSIQARGKEENSKTDIILEQGTIVTEIQNALRKSETYKVTTPNAVMAVRGTVFRVEQTKNENGEMLAKLAVFDGVVSVQTKNADGSLADPVMVESGTSAEVIGECGNTTLQTYDYIDYSQLSAETLDFLKEIITEHGTQLSISIEELNEYINESQEQTDNNDAAQTDGSEQSTGDSQDTTSGNHSQTKDDAAKTQTDTTTQSASTTQKQPEKTESDQKPESTETSKSKDKKKSSKEKNNTKSKDDTKKSKDKKTISKKQKTSHNSAATTQQPTVVATENQTGSDKTKNESTTEKKPVVDNATKPDTSTEQTKPVVTTQETTVYTVTFMYDGKVFGTQQVEKGKKAQKPVLLPAKKGAWEFDFDTPITSDVTIVFK